MAEYNDVALDVELTEAEKARLEDELKNVVANLKWISVEMKATGGLKKTWMNLEIDRRHIMRELHAGRRLRVEDNCMMDLERPFELDHV